jgi:hypothetical protein
MAEEKSVDCEAWLDALAPVLGLPIATDYRDAVIANLRMILLQAELVTGFTLDDHEDPAPVFRA